ncbi:PBP1A family penicillin-binding protein [Lacticaseibacillus paracasei]|uniref:PBP1A family penicillin-binding protein n=1 Tax=Lacticaseibacillus paracasei TaxID=1597 RepID=UPI000343C985|nr:PBP1A family penicillin-binding protein [Lacticaseibacillus paracasei]EPC12139.1 Multimodular transpeptidase-transglycosylase [Lacticaseibacillus paracasei subsp. paracasei Lpp230]MCT3360433.1 PBP1A family penicillin-binding protein [Lacticaseibacillus paracasei]MCU6429435.1 PBP1A family penicillin-binding protein [Lacticaseibacillus paracasei]MDP0529864.1 PBP1A family penicillin-binding protein [Lacticaseibacillus paracasei]QOP46985.1 PBP1A family penicillin-binding protein [Lacticaseibaci
MADNQNMSRMARRREDKFTKGSAPKPPKRLWRRILKWTLLAILAFFILGVGLFSWYAKDAPEVTQAKLESGGSSTIYDRSGNEITTLGLESRDYVKASEIPQQLKDAVVSIEDRRFYDEKLGVDPVRIIGAAFNNITGTSDGLQGGSTLTQQLIKLSVFSTKSSDQTLRRKAQEAWLAMQVQQKYSKDQILEYYINKVFMNYGQYGMSTGAKFYFNKSLKDLTLAQTAFIAGLPQSPAGYDPYEYPQKATQRRNAVIDAMLRDKKITATAAKQAKATPITDGLKPKQQQTNTATNDKVIDSYLTQVIAEVKKKTGLNPYTDNLDIYTNIDMGAQRRLYDIVNTDEYVNFPDDAFQTGVTMTDPNNGQVLAQIGGRKTGDVRLAYNRAAQNTRSNGSTMKPLMDYGPAIEYLNYSTYEQMTDEPYTYPGTSISLYDWDKKYQGRISMRTALEQSRNIPAVKTLSTVGMANAVKFLSGLGINLPSSEQYLSSAIGASVNTVQEAGAYGAFANGGTYYKPYYVSKVVTADGNTQTFNSQGSRAMKSSTAYMITDMLKGVLTKGTGTSAAISGLYQAGKTGTTDYSDAELQQNPALNATGIAKDAWFTGYTRSRVISVWTGYDKPTSHGINYAEQTISQEIYKALMTYTSQSLTNRDWTKPDTVESYNILKGSNPGTAITGGSGDTTKELYVRGHGPSSRKAAVESSSSSSSSSASSSSRESIESSSSVSSSEPVVSASASSQPSNQEPSASSSEPSTPSGSGSGSGGSNNP